MATTSLYALPAKEGLQKLFVGKNLKDIATPAAVLDLSKLEKNCNRMLEAVEELKFSWRAHIKTHKVHSYIFTRVSSESSSSFQESTNIKSVVVLHFN
jgi:D-serine deaminase-like pyridoxal phosphate-dependent protein